MVDTLYLGYTDYAPKPHTRITCVAQAFGGMWQKVDDLSADLPPLGKVFAVNLPWAKSHQPLAVTTIPNPRDVDEDKDRLIVDQADALRQVLDFRDSGMEAARYALIEKGILRAAPYSSDVIVALSDTLCAVLSLSPDPVTGRLVASAGTVKLYEFNSEVFRGDRFDDQYLEVPGLTVGNFQEEVQWYLDQDLLDLLLKRLKKFDEEGPTKAERERIISVLNRSKALAKEEPEWTAFSAWLDGFGSRANEYLEGAEMAASELAKLSPVREELDHLRERAKLELKNELEPEVRKEIERDLSELYDKWDQVEAELEEKLGELEAARSEGSEISKTFDALNRQLTQELAALNESLGEAIDPDSDDARGLVERFREALGDSGSLIQPDDHSVPPWARVRNVNASKIVDFAEFSGRLMSECRRAGLSENDMMALDIGLRSGALTLLPQQSAEVFLPIYAESATGGELVRQALGPGLLGLDDLWQDPVRRSLTGFARSWNHALRDNSRFYLVWLDGLQRTPIDVWLPSLVGVLGSPGRPKNLLVVTSLGEPLLDPDRVWPELKGATVPLAPSITGLRPARLLSSAQGQRPEQTLVSANDSVSFDRDQLMDFLADIKDSVSSVAQSVEVSLYLAANSLYASSDRSPGEVLKQVEESRMKGREWLESIFEG